MAIEVVLLALAAVPLAAGYLLVVRATARGSWKALRAAFTCRPSSGSAQR